MKFFEASQDLPSLLRYNFLKKLVCLCGVLGVRLLELLGTENAKKKAYQGLPFDVGV